MLYNLHREYKHIIKDVKILKFRTLLNSYELLAEIIFIDDSMPLTGPIFQPFRIINTLRMFHKLRLQKKKI